MEPPSTRASGAGPTPARFSVVVPVRNAAERLGECLSALAAQEDPPRFEVIVVDDGSLEPVAPAVSHWRFAKVHRQIPLGISAARNLGIAKASGDVLVFLDSDCLAHPRMLANLEERVDAEPTQAAFQLALRGGDGCLTDRLEGFRLEAIQRAALRPDGRMDYLNTSGFAIRREVLVGDPNLFTVSVVRGEDSVLLARLLRDDLVPRFLEDVVVSHRPGMPFPRYLLKHFWIGYHASNARSILARHGHGFLTARSRVSLFSGIAQDASGRGERLLATALIGACYTVERLGRAAHAIFGMKRGRRPVLDCVVDLVSQTEVMARCLAAAGQQGILVTYLTAWTLVQAHRNQAFAAQLAAADLVYADGIGAVFALALTSFARCRKVTANDFFVELCRGAAQRRLRIALFGSTKSVIDRARLRLSGRVPDLDIAFASSGFVDPEESGATLAEIRKVEPDIIFVGMGQPLQEEWAEQLHKELPRAVVYCVGGLFDVVSGDLPTPPSWIRRVGLEWLYRLVTRPTSVWRRYVIGIPELAWIIARHWFTGAHRRSRFRVVRS